MIVPPYTTLVQSHLGCAVLGTQFKTDIKLLEYVQRGVTKAWKVVEDLQDKTYEEQLKSLGLFSLEETRLRGDLIAVHNFPKGGSRGGGPGDQ